MNDLLQKGLETMMNEQILPNLTGGVHANASNSVTPINTSSK